MNAKSGPNAMNANKLYELIRQACLLAGLVLLAFSLFATRGHAAEGSAPAMSNVKEILVLGVKPGNEAVTQMCGIKPDKLTQYIVKTLKSYSLPATSALEAKPTRFDTARIEVLPEILSTNTQGIECTSWVSLTAQSENTLHIPPIETPRNVLVTYWRGGVLVSSVVPSHQQVLTNTFEKLCRKFAQQYRMDQPPPLPVFDESAD